jgi:hypothetical protein
VNHAHIDSSAPVTLARVVALLRLHRNCVAGDGDSSDNCTARRQLLTTRQMRGWTFPVPPPTHPARGVRR